jgi:group I intron endonuclease
MSDSIFCNYYFFNKINGKMYIGKANNFDDRLKEHLKSSQVDHPKYLIHRAIKKYGIDNFDINVFAIFDSEKEALLSEMYWIQYLKKQGIVLYNLTDGGDGVSGFKHSDETKKHWSETRTGKMTGAKHPLYGKPRPEDVKNKSREKQLGRKIAPHIIAKIVASNTGKKRSQNICDMMSKTRLGEGNPNSKLDWNKVSKIRDLLKSDKMTQDEIAKLFSITRTIVSRIKNNKIWKI